MSCIPTSSINQSTSKVKVKKKLSKNGKSRARRMPTYLWEIFSDLEMPFHPSNNYLEEDIAIAMTSTISSL
jgi:hypothetical protein